VPVIKHNHPEIFVDYITSRLMLTRTPICTGWDLAECLSLYPGLLFLASPTTISRDNPCHEAIDAVINCEPAVSADDGSLAAALWRQYFADEVPELIQSLSDARLIQTIRKLARAEPREMRMAKVLRTAKRLAMAKNTPVTLDHVMLIVRSSLSPQGAQDFDKAGADTDVAEI